MIRGFKEVIPQKRKNTQEFRLPERSTKHSAGYDFKTPINFTIKPNETFKLPTNIKAYMIENEVLELYVRSSVGIKRNIVLANGTGIVDKDFFGNLANDGNITLFLYNFGTEKQSFKIGDKIAQGIFKKFLTADSGNSDNVRVGGTGSTDK
jgi:dUTP pyrophosphatase